MITRRQAVTSSLALGALALVGGAGRALARHATTQDAGTTAASGPAPKSLRLLILGGTGFLGPAIVEAAKARGHTLTLFNRGRTEKRIGMIDGVEKLVGNREPGLPADESDPDSPKGFAQLEERIKEGATWDAVVDTWASIPRLVKVAAELTAPACAHYVFISTISVYEQHNQPGADESARVATIDDPDAPLNNATYGALKALCEQEAEKHFPGRSTSIRPGFIVGPGDPTDRFTYWPVRAQQGGEFLCPGDGTDPVQFIDVRDLAAFIVRCIEQKSMGVFNATGPATTLTASAFIDACVQAAKAKGGPAATPVWMSWEGIRGFNEPVDTTILLPAEGETAGFHVRNCQKAINAGLVFRPALDTCADTLAWWPKEVERRTRVTRQLIDDAKKAGKPEPTMPDPAQLRAGVRGPVEKRALDAWMHTGASVKPK